VTVSFVTMAKAPPVLVLAMLVLAVVALVKYVFFR
jgi:hypothetical protein